MCPFRRHSGRKEAEASLREQESLTTLGQMAAVVAHEMKNPLAGLAGALQVLKSRRPAHDPEVLVFDEMLACIHSLDRLDVRANRRLQPASLSTGLDA